ncbi:MAG: hypothetical protein ACLP9Y_17070 [Mycobacterium sp.]
MDWSTGRRNSGISAGDRVFMLRHGTKGRGIVASGTVLSEIWQGEDWDGSQAVENYVDIRLDTVLPVDDALSTAVLNQALPEASWDRRQASGTLH